MKLREAPLSRAVALSEQWPPSVTFSVTDVRILHADLDAGALETLLRGSPGSSDVGVCVCVIRRASLGLVCLL